MESHISSRQHSFKSSVGFERIELLVLIPCSSQNRVNLYTQDMIFPTTNNNGKSIISKKSAKRMMFAHLSQFKRQLLQANISERSY